LSGHKSPTQEEIDFIDGLGRDRWGIARGKDRQKLLQGYYQSISGRDNWEGIDKWVVIKYVQAELCIN
jgi:hypothetical protein